MKYYAFYKSSLIAAFIFISSSGAKSQKNLVLNYSFENYTICPSGYYNPPPPPWYLATNYGCCGGVYLNACDTSIWHGVPNNIVGGGNSFQYARTGNAYIGLDYRNGPFRTYVQVKLFDSLKTGHFYYGEHFVNTPNDIRYACNNIAMLFTDTAIYADTTSYYPPILVNPQVVNFSNPVVTDTLNWIKVSGVFKAKGGEKYLTLGNFKDDKHTTFVQFQPIGYPGVSYYVDDVSVYDLDSFHLKADAGRDTTITIGDSVFLGSYTNGIDTIKWINKNTGQVIDSLRPGFWVSPTVNTCYVVTQTVNGFISSDTVCVFVMGLPVTITKYEIQNRDNKAIVNSWQTANEVNVSHFNIQRSSSGNAKDFQTIGTLPAKGIGKYEWADNNAPLSLGRGGAGGEALFYRLETVDKDGSKTYSQIMSIKPNEEDLGITINPNPTKGVVTVYFPASNVGCKRIKITNIYGKTIVDKLVSATDHKIQLEINATPGIYFLNSINCTTGQQTTTKVLVQ